MTISSSCLSFLALFSTLSWWSTSNMSSLAWRFFELYICDDCFLRPIWSMIESTICSWLKLVAVKTLSMLAKWINLFFTIEYLESICWILRCWILSSLWISSSLYYLSCAISSLISSLRPVSLSSFPFVSVKSL